MADRQGICHRCILVRAYAVPGLILGIVVGGSATVATLATIRSASASAGAAASLVAGLILVGWSTWASGC